MLLTEAIKSTTMLHNNNIYATMALALVLAITLRARRAILSLPWTAQHQFNTRNTATGFISHPFVEKRLDTGTLPTTFDPNYVHKRVYTNAYCIIYYTVYYIYQYSITFLGRLSCVNHKRYSYMFFLPPEWLRMNVRRTLRPIRWDI